MNELDRWEELKRLLQDDYITIKKEFEKDFYMKRGLEKDHFFAVMQTLDRIFSYIETLEKSKPFSNGKEIIDSVYCVENPSGYRYVLKLYSLSGKMFEYEVTKNFFTSFTKYFVGF